MLRLQTLVLVCAVMLVPGFARAASYTWTGTTSLDWATAGNWTPAGVPGAADAVTIGSNKVVTAAANYTVSALTLESGSTLQGAGNITVTNTFTSYDATLDGLGMITVAAGGTTEIFNNSGGAKFKKRFKNSGWMNVNGGNMSLGADFENAVGGTVEIKNDAAIQWMGAVRPKISNAGTFKKSSGTGTMTITANFVNTGTVIAGAGTLRFDADYTQTAGTTTLNGGEIRTSSALNINGGILNGIGTIEGNVVNNASFKPGHSPGITTINGNYTQGATGVLDMEVGGLTPGTQFDQLVVNGTASLGGTFNVVQYAGFAPAESDSFQFVTYYSCSGTFSTVNNYWVGQQRYFTPTLTPTYYFATCHVDLNGPTVGVTAPIVEKGYASFTTATGTASDTWSGLASVSPLTARLYRYAGASTAGYWSGGTTWATTYTAAANERPVTGTATWSLTMPTLAANNKYSLRLTAKDKVGNTTVGPDVIFYIDSTVPATVTFTAPAASAFVKNLNSVSGTATDNTNGSGITSATLIVKRNSDAKFWTGTAWGTTSTPLATTVVGTTWSLSSGLPSGVDLPNGAYLLTATAYDKTGNLKTATNTVTVDAIAPTVTVTTPVNNTNYTALTSTTGTAADAGGLLKVTVMLYRYATASVTAAYWGGGTTWSAAYTAAANERLATGTTSWTLTFPTLTNGQYYLVATATDKAGNVTPSTAVGFWKTAGTSTLTLSTYTATASTNKINLTYTGALDATVAQTVLRYYITINGTPVSVSSAVYTATGNVALNMPAGALTTGATVVVKWTNLYDTTGKTLSGQTAAFTSQ